MKRLLSDKRAYFAAFGAVGGLLSAAVYRHFHPYEQAWMSWVSLVGVDGLLTASLLSIAQNLYAGKRRDALKVRKPLIVGTLGGIAGGLIAYNVGFPLARMLGGEVHVGRFMGWTIFGIVMGLAITKSVPNLRTAPACLAGGVGAFLGCSVMYLLGTGAGIGFFLGVAVASAMIGLAIAYAETAFRQAWLEVTIKPKGLTLEKERTLTVTLGDKPVLFGCAGDADVKLAEMAGAKAHFAKVSLSGGKVTLLDMTTEKTREIAVDEGFNVSNARVVVRNKVVAGAVG